MGVNLFFIFLILLEKFKVVVLCVEVEYLINVININNSRVFKGERFLYFFMLMFF